MVANQQALRNLTTMGVGGVPQQLLVAKTKQEIVEMALQIWREADDWLILGGGSNLVVAEEISDLQVLQIATTGVQTSRIGESNKYLLRVQAGEIWDDLVAGTVEAGLSGLEALSGIPGSVGAAPIQNIGAYGAEVANTIRRVEFLDFQLGELQTIEAENLELQYRTSVFKKGLLGVITWVEFELEHLGGLSQPIMFDQLAKALAVEIGAQVAVADVRKAVLALRAAKGMVYSQTDADTHGCGSFFTNPIVSERHARTLPFDAPRWETSGETGTASHAGKTEDTVKLSAAWLIEHAGIPKGFSLPGSRVSLSSKHTLAITNRGGALAGEVLELAEFIQARVANTFGVNLQPEPTIVGF